MSLRIFYSLSTRNELYDYVLIDNSRLIAIMGQSTPFDIPTEIWRYSTGSTEIDNGVTVIKPTEVFSGDTGRFLRENFMVKQYGNYYSKEFKTGTTTSLSAVTFDISSAGFSTIVDYDVKAYLSGSSITTIPLAVVTSKSLSAITVTLLESKTTNTLIDTTVEGLEGHAISGTEIYLTVQGT